jgi:hypothetical protein
MSDTIAMTANCMWGTLTEGSCSCLDLYYGDACHYYTWDDPWRTKIQVVNAFWALCAALTIVVAIYQSIQLGNHSRNRSVIHTTTSHTLM